MEFIMEERVRKQFWFGLLRAADKHTQLHSKHLTELPKGHDCKVPTGVTGVSYLYEIRDTRGYSHIYINGPKEYNKDVLRQLEQWKVEIHAAFVDELEWHLKPEQKSSYFGKYFWSGGLQHQDRWPEIQREMIDAMVRLQRTMPQFFDRLKP
jgi:hypothetical protein